MLDGAWVLLVLVSALAVLGILEVFVHRRRLERIRIRVHVNGTRGKSSVVRLIAAGLRAAGVRTCAKTTGTLARMILPDGREVPIFRPSNPNVIEQKRIVATAAAFGAEALVIECMALQPELQALSEQRLVRATHGVITNARPDHLEVMGPTARDVALALAGTTPRRGKLYTAEQVELEAFARAARDRSTELVVVEAAEIDAVSGEELAGFTYTEHPVNVALALRVCADLGIPRELALRGMHAAAPDPGALTEHHLDFFGRRIAFFNAFAANDPVSTRQLWALAVARTPEAATRLAIFNCRADRPERSLQLASDFVSWASAPDGVLLMGTGTHLFARAAAAAGYDATRFVTVEDLRVDEIFERVLSLCNQPTLVVGMGNIGGQGLDLVRYFKNRAPPPPVRAARSGADCA